jgi:pilus assembly protein CpaE
VIIVTALTAETDVATSLDEGAIDHISKPFSELIVRTRVRAALRSRVPATGVPPPRKRGKRIGFIGAKGGVGVSTAVVNTALTMMSPQRSVAIVELRPYPGTVAQQLGLSSERNLTPLLDLPPAGIDAASVRKCLTLHRSGLQVLLAPPLVDDQREITVQQAEGILNAMSEIADFVIVDLAFPPSKVTRAVVRCCAFVVVTIELEATCLAAARSLLEGLAAWDVAHDSVGALLVLHHASAGTTITVKFASSQVACGLIGVIPPAGEANLVALKGAKPLVFSAPDSVVAMAFMELGARLMADNVATMKMKL